MPWRLVTTSTVSEPPTRNRKKNPLRTCVKKLSCHTQLRTIPFVGTGSWMPSLPRSKRTVTVAVWEIPHSSNHCNGTCSSHMGHGMATSRSTERKMAVKDFRRVQIFRLQELHDLIVCTILWKLAGRVEVRKPLPSHTPI